jgi:hypothetical protein
MIAREKLRTLIEPFLRELCEEVWGNAASFTPTAVLYVVTARDRDRMAFRCKQRILRLYSACHGVVSLDLARADTLIGFLPLEDAIDVFREAIITLREPRNGRQFLVVATDDDGLLVGDLPRALLVQDARLDKAAG